MNKTGKRILISTSATLLGLGTATAIIVPTVKHFQKKSDSKKVPVFGQVSYQVKNNAEYLILGTAYINDGSLTEQISLQNENSKTKIEFVSAIEKDNLLEIKLSKPFVFNAFEPINVKITLNDTNGKLLTYSVVSLDINKMSPNYPFFSNAGTPDGKLWDRKTYQINTKYISDDDMKDISISADIDNKIASHQFKLDDNLVNGKLIVSFEQEFKLTDEERQFTFDLKIKGKEFKSKATIPQNYKITPKISEKASFNYNDMKTITVGALGNWTDGTDLTKSFSLIDKKNADNKLVYNAIYKDEAFEDGNGEHPGVQIELKTPLDEYEDIDIEIQFNWDGDDFTNANHQTIELQTSAKKFEPKFSDGTWLADNKTLEINTTYLTDNANDLDKNTLLDKTKLKLIKDNNDETSKIDVINFKSGKENGTIDIVMKQPYNVIPGQPQNFEVSFSYDNDKRQVNSKAVLQAYKLDEVKAISKTQISFTWENNAVPLGWEKDTYQIKTGNNVFETIDIKNIQDNNGTFVATLNKPLVKGTNYDLSVVSPNSNEGWLHSIDTSNIWTIINIKEVNANTDLGGTKISGLTLYGNNLDLIKNVKKTKVLGIESIAPVLKIENEYPNNDYDEKGKTASTSLLLKNLSITGSQNKLVLSFSRISYPGITPDIGETPTDVSLKFKIKTDSFEINDKGYFGQSDIEVENFNQWKGYKGKGLPVWDNNPNNWVNIDFLGGKYNDTAVIDKTGRYLGLRRTNITKNSDNIDKIEYLAPSLPKIISWVEIETSSDGGKHWDKYDKSLLSYGGDIKYQKITSGKRINSDIEATQIIIFQLPAPGLFSGNTNYSFPKDLKFRIKIPQIMDDFKEITKNTSQSGGDKVSHWTGTPNPQFPDDWKLDDLFK